MSDRTFTRLTEENDWEGETWHFYIPTQGNEENLAKLAALVATDGRFDVEEQQFTEAEIDTLIAYGDDTDYLHAHNKLSGTLAEVSDVDTLYKGGITDYLTAGGAGV